MRTRGLVASHSLFFYRGAVPSRWFNLPCVTYCTSSKGGHQNILLPAKNRRGVIWVLALHASYSKLTRVQRIWLFLRKLKTQTLLWVQNLNLRHIYFIRFFDFRRRFLRDWLQRIWNQDEVLRFWYLSWFKKKCLGHVSTFFKLWSQTCKKRLKKRKTFFINIS